MCESLDAAPSAPALPYEFVRQGTDVSVTYRAAYYSMQSHAPEFVTLQLPRHFFERREHIFSASPRVTNHDPLAFLHFTQMLDKMDKDTVVVVEFGVWRASFLENLAIHASESGKRLVVYGFDTFEAFPDIASEQDLSTRTLEAYRTSIEQNKPLSMGQVRQRLSSYSSIAELNLIAGDITKLNVNPIEADLVHFDMDFYGAFHAAMRWISNIHTATLLIDDYYQPSWPGIVRDTYK